jgi:uncharacterized protein YecE (DUF72 family)
MFDTVEVNNSFYRLPEAATFEAWKRRSPPGFLFAVKASRFLTHMKKLKDPEDPLARFFERAGRLGRKLGPVLYQLPPRWPVDQSRFEAFLAALPRGRRHAVEFREPSWYRPPIFELLKKYGVALCLHDMPGSAAPRRSEGPFVYLRFHGWGSRYGGAIPIVSFRNGPIGSCGAARRADPSIPISTTMRGDTPPGMPCVSGG